MTNPDLTELIFVLDRSGSMWDQKVETEGGFNSLIDEQKKQPGKAKVTLAQFDNEYELVYEGKDIKKVKPLNLIPRGITALNDAIGKTIVTTGERFAALEEEDRPGTVIFVILTDGLENASQEYTDPASIKALIDEQTNKYNWVFTFLGADKDAILTAKSYGIADSSALVYAGAATGNAFSAVSSNVSLTRSGIGSFGYTQAQRTNSLTTE